MVIGNAPYDFIAEHYGKPLVVAGFEPLDVLQSIWMVLKQIDEGRCDVENQYSRVVPGGRQCGGARRASAGCSSCASSSNGGDSARSIIPACACARRMPRYDAERKFSVPSDQDRRSEVLPVRRGPEGRDQAAGMQGVRQRLHARDAARRADGVVRRRLRRLLPVRRRREDPRQARRDAARRVRCHERRPAPHDAAPLRPGATCRRSPWPMAAAARRCAI